jgi:hypothetical protein
MVLLNREDLKDRGINYSPVTLWRRAKAGTFPRPVKLSPSRNGWIADEIDSGSPIASQSVPNPRNPGARA